VLSKDGHYEKLAEAFGGAGYEAKTPAALSAALTRALDSRAPALIDCAVDPTAGTESGHLSNLNPKSSVGPKR
jgi:oxalyl-CoA decarboxylase